MQIPVLQGKVSSTAASRSLPACPS